MVSVAITEVIKTLAEAEQRFYLIRTESHTLVSHLPSFLMSGCIAIAIKRALSLRDASRMPSHSSG